MKTPKGCVAIEKHHERIRLRWTYGGKRFCFALGFPYSAINLKAAEEKARRIELDMLTGHFDITLQKYKQPCLKPVVIETPSITVKDLFQKFVEYKSKSLCSRSIEKYTVIHKRLEDFFDCKTAASVSVDDAESFFDLLKQNLEPITLKERLTLLKACWDWANKQKIIEGNPWTEMPSRVKVAPKQMPKPFTKQELRAILDAFRNNNYYKHYAPFVEFRMLTGTRVSEAIGLRWQDIADDFSTIWIGSSLSRGERKATKNNKARTLPCNDKLKNLLKSIKPVDTKPQDLVFLSPKGLAIRDTEFTKRAWKTCLGEAGVDYRTFYTLRHTFISHCLEMGLTPMTVAKITGHDVQVLYEHYAGCVRNVEIPGFFD